MLHFSYNKILGNIFGSMLTEETPKLASGSLPCTMSQSTQHCISACVSGKLWQLPLSA